MVLGPPRKLSVVVSRNRRTSLLCSEFLGSDVFAAEDILLNKKGCWQPGLSSVLSVTECLVTSFLIGSTKTKEEVKMSSFIYQKTALLRATKFSQKES
jgi:hypothetical protein